MPGLFVAQKPPPPPPSRELVALRVFAATIRALYRRGGAITRRQVKTALDTLDKATREP